MLFYYQILIHKLTKMMLGIECQSCSLLQACIISLSNRWIQYVGCRMLDLILQIWIKYCAFNCNLHWYCMSTFSASVSNMNCLSKQPLYALPRANCLVTHSPCQQVVSKGCGLDCWWHVQYLRVNDTACPGR